MSKKFVDYFTLNQNYRGVFWDIVGGFNPNRLNKFFVVVSDHSRIHQSILSELDSHNAIIKIVPVIHLCGDYAVFKLKVVIKLFRYDLFPLGLLLRSECPMRRGVEFVQARDLT